VGRPSLPRPPPLDRSIPSELSLIVFKAMEKEMNRRYATAEAFADDLKRYQEGRPIAAHPPSLLYRLRKRLRRNKPLVAGVLIAVAMGALVIPGWLHERQTREVQLESLRELSGLWNEVTVARQGWYQAQKDPVKTRAQIEKCVGAIGDYITRYPSQPQGYYVRAQAQLYLGELDAAREDLEKATRLDPQFAPGWALLGRVLLEIYQGLLFSSRTKTSKAILDRANPTLKSAEQAFEKGWRGGAERISIKTWGLARMDEDGVAETLAKALSIRFVEHDNDRSRKLIEEAQRSAPSEEYCYLLGLWEKDLAKEVEWQTKALEIMPHYAKAFVERGFARWKLGDTARSIEDFSRALAVQPRHVAAWVNRGCVLLATGEAGPAVADLSQALQINPKLAIAYSDRSWGKVLLKDYEGAVADALRAIELEPKFIEAYANLSVARSRQGKYTEALDAANKAIAIEPRAEVYLNRALARTGLGEISAAIEDCTKALELHPNLEEALLNRALLRESLAAKSDKPEELLRLAEADAAKAVEQGGANKKFAEATLKRLRQKLSRDY
jgi:tetratricopeptide (TPR) repeat protein